MPNGYAGSDALYEHFYPSSRADRHLISSIAPKHCIYVSDTGIMVACTRQGRKVYSSFFSSPPSWQLKTPQQLLPHLPAPGRRRLCSLLRARTAKHVACLVELVQPHSMKRQNMDLCSARHHCMWGSVAMCAASQACILARTVSPGGVRGR
jgi:hypothetical protein